MKNNKKGFTLVEIMIVVVIIGLLAAMAIPAFQKVRTNSIGKAMENDARQLASACQQYILENAGTTAVTFAVTAATGVVGAPIDEYVRTISKGTTFSGTYNGVAAQGASAFTLTNTSYRAGAVNFDTEGKKLD